MDTSYLSIFIFIIITIIYYAALKPKLNISALDNGDEYTKYTKSNYSALAVYFILIIISQLFVNSIYIIKTCGGSVTSNIGAAFLITFIPWILIFGVLIFVLIIFPGFKSAFSNVIGYFWVSNTANKILTEMLVNPEVEDAINNDPKLNSSTSSSSSTKKISGGSGKNKQRGGADLYNTSSNMNNDNIDEKQPSRITPVATPVDSPVIATPIERPSLTNITSDYDGEGLKSNKKKKYQNAADTIIKLFGDMSILINQIVPYNFKNYMSTLSPLMKEKYQVDNDDTKLLKQKLLDVVVLRDNIGEALWYVNIAILITSVVQYNISVNGCSKDLESISAGQNDFLKTQEASQAKITAEKSKEYIISNAA